MAEVGLVTITLRGEVPRLSIARDKRYETGVKKRIDGGANVRKNKGIVVSDRGLRRRGGPLSRGKTAEDGS
jgi:hypothetical protein